MATVLAPQNEKSKKTVFTHFRWRCNDDDNDDRPQFSAFY